MIIYAFINYLGILNGFFITFGLLKSYIGYLENNSSLSYVGF